MTTRSRIRNFFCYKFFLLNVDKILLKILFFRVRDYMLILNDFIISIVLRERTKKLSLNFLINIYLFFSTTFARNLLVELLYQIRRIFELFCKQSLIINIFSIELFNFISNIFFVVCFIQNFFNFLLFFIID